MMNEEKRSVEKGNESIPRREFLRISGTTAFLSTGVLLADAGRAWPEATGKTIRMAVVGGGFGRTFHWHEHPNCVITAVTDLRADRREKLRESYKCDNVYDSLEEMIIKEKNIDAVAVFSGATDHAKHVKMCMERGWHVVSAVPACTSLEEAAMLKEIKERTGLRYMMAESSYYQQRAIHARNLYKEGILGEVFYSEVEYYHDRGDLKKLGTDKKSRFFMPDGSHSWRWGLPPLFYPTHALGHIVGLTKERMTKVSCLGWRGNRVDLRNHPWVSNNEYNNFYWNESSIMRTNKDHICRCNGFWLCAAGGEKANLFGDKATVYMGAVGVLRDTIRFRRNEHRGTEYDLPEQRGGELKIPNYWNSDMLPKQMRHGSGHGGSAVFISAEFVNALLEDREPSIDIYESLAMTVPGLVAHQSALKDGEQLTIPQFDLAG
jgi:predicted dehydrogenase